jgi:spore coat polysaccharide biosynthesis protein SpsF
MTDYNSCSKPTSKVGIIIQARMSSQRLPGKILASIGEKPLLLYLFERLQIVSNSNGVLLITSVESSDDAVVEFAERYSIPVFRGSLNNVAERFRDAALLYRLDAFVRISGDSPLLDQSLVTQAIERFRNEDADIVTNVMPRTFPKGQSVEVLRARVFNDAYTKFDQASDFEHVTTYFYRNVERFKIVNFRAGQDYSDLQFSVDTQADLVNITKLVSMMARPHWDYTLEEMIELYRKAAG